MRQSSSVIASNGFSRSPPVREHSSFIVAKCLPWQHARNSLGDPLPAWVVKCKSCSDALPTLPPPPAPPWPVDEFETPQLNELTSIQPSCPCECDSPSIPSNFM